MRRLTLIDRDTGEVLMEFPRAHQSNLEKDHTADFIVALAAVLVGFVLVTIT